MRARWDPQQENLGAHTPFNAGERHVLIYTPAFDINIPDEYVEDVYSTCCNIYWILVMAN